MKFYVKGFTILIFLLSLSMLFVFCDNTYTKPPKLQVCLTFDDTFPRSNSLFDSETGNQMVLDQLKKHNIQAMFFLKAKVLLSDNGQQMANKWNNAGHLIGNHSFSHYNYHNDKVSFEIYRDDFLKADSLLKQFNNFQQYYRYPMLREGNSIQKRDKFRKILNDMDYKIGYVSVDNSEWYINHRLRKKLINNESFDIDKYKQVYIKHLSNLINEFDRIAKLTTDKKIPHVLLLHNNITSSLYLDDIVKMCKNNNWEIVSPNVVYKNEFYNSYPDVVWYKGESLILSKAKAEGKLTESMANTTDTEHKRLEKEMNELGL